ncbi:hypothetical protein PR048_018650 [Dryococelus australis]|uniref:Uncharacterized protein n=1 Tax=Dryococelus australis TaxID=614101 RepID=A0ABQ9HCW0_9NEOP|nr:hypothetical protein PR048_018650 [Dryococelus australis]
MNNVEKINALRNVWNPVSKYKFPVEDCGRFRRKFQLKWFDAFNWLAYSELNRLVIVVNFFLDSEFAGKGCHKAVGQLASRPSKNLKYALETFRNHEKSNYHKKCFLAAENVRAVIEKETGQYHFSD